MASKKSKKETRPCKYCEHPIPVGREQCPSCRMLNVESNESSDFFGLVSLSDTEYVPMNLLRTGEWDKNFGCQVDDNGKEFVGHPDTTITLLGGKNGAGKSTILIQTALKLIRERPVKDWDIKTCGPKEAVIYLSAEEGNGPIRARAKRLGMTLEEQKRLLISPLGKTINLEPAMRHFDPIMLMGDSVSKIAPDPAEAVRFCDNLRPLCDEMKIPAIMLCHINKDGDMAGFEALQHSVDCTAMLSIDTDKIRALETQKNRNGIELTTLYRMTPKGLIRAMDMEKELENEDEEEYDDDDDE